jgi:hypothetical protein
MVSFAKAHSSGFDGVDCCCVGHSSDVPAVATARMLLVPAVTLRLCYGAGLGFFLPVMCMLLVSAW